MSTVTKARFDEEIGHISSWGVAFSPRDLTENPWLVKYGVEYIRSYEGGNRFLLDLKGQLARKGRLSELQTCRALDNFRAYLVERDGGTVKPQTDPVEETKKTPVSGRSYRMIYEGSEHWVKVEDAPDGTPGKQIISFQYGGTYTMFGFLNQGNCWLIRKYRYSNRLRTIISKFGTLKN